MTPPDRELLGDLLKRVSRSFYLTLRALPGSVRRQIGLAYLLARATDTIADTPIVPLERRLQALARFRERILGVGSGPLEFGDLAASQGTPGERALLEKSEFALELLLTLSQSDLDLVRRVLDTITGGQELDLQRFGRVLPGQVQALRSAAELDDYTYRVAGCVGDFWTRICRAHLFPDFPLDEAKLLQDSVRFGKGLQLVNILRDLPTDLKNGRCYLPEDQLSSQGLAPGDLLRADAEPRLRPVYDEWLDRAAGHLAAGWTYTNALPRLQVRVRLTCAWPILIGVRTLELLRSNPALGAPCKVTRKDVTAIIRRSILLYPFKGAWQRLGPELR